jgi:hypothetical protein
MRIRTILAAAAAPAGLVGVLLGTAGQASAATVPNPKSVITVTDQVQADALMKQVRSARTSTCPLARTCSSAGRPSTVT